MSLHQRRATARTEHVSDSLDKCVLSMFTCMIFSLAPFFFLFADKEYAGRDITLAIGLMKTDDQWLDRFVKMEEKWIKDAKGWVEYMESKYTACGKLEKWDEDQETWPELTEEEKEAINKCVIM